MNEGELIEALLDIVDDARTEDRETSEKLAVLGYAERRGRRSVFWPTNAGWNLLGERGRPFYLLAEDRGPRKHGPRLV